MRSFQEWIIEEKVLTSLLIIFCSLMVLALVYIKADKEYTMTFCLAVSGLIASLTRGTTHNPVQDSTQRVSSQTLTVVTPVAPAPAGSTEVPLPGFAAVNPQNGTKQGGI